MRMYILESKRLVQSCAAAVMGHDRAGRGYIAWLLVLPLLLIWLRARDTPLFTLSLECIPHARSAARAQSPLYYALAIPPRNWFFPRQNSPTYTCNQSRFDGPAHWSFGSRLKERWNSSGTDREEATAFRECLGPESLFFSQSISRSMRLHIYSIIYIRVFFSSQKSNIFSRAYSLVFLVYFMDLSQRFRRIPLW